MAFPAGKFALPHVQTTALDRVALRESLGDDAFAAALTLLVAPAGYGKSTLAAQLARQLRGQAIWLTLDEDDNEPRRLIAAVATALGRRVPFIGRAVPAVLDSHPNTDGVLLALSAMLNAVSQHPEQLLIILDDGEKLRSSPAIELFRNLVLRVPDNLHLLLASRAVPDIPLARWRLRGLLAERGPEDLRFSPGEVEELVNRRLGLTLSPGAVERLMQRTEGWPAGVRMLAGERTVAGSPRSEAELYAFFTRQVFDAQPPEVRRFLAAIAVLSEISVPACVAVTGRTDAADLLEHLADRGLFLLQRTGGEVYRFHALVAEFLRRKVERWSVDARQRLHRRAAAAERDTVAVIGHLLRGGDQAAAVDLLETEGLSLLSEGRAVSLGELLGKLPEDVLHRPQLLRLRGELAFLSGDLAAARAAFAASGLSGPVLARQAECLYLQGDREASRVLLDRALRSTLEPDMTVRVGLIRTQLAQLAGDAEQARRSLRAVLEVVDAGHTMVVAATHVLPTFCLTPGVLGDLDRFVETARRCLAEGLPRLQVDALAVFVDALRGRHDKARAQVLRIDAEYARYGGAPPLIGLALAFTEVLLLKGDETAAEIDRKLSQMTSRAEMLPHLWFAQPGAWFLVGRVRWSLGHLDQAREALARIPAHLTDAPADNPAVVNRLSLAGMLASTAGEHREAERLLRAAVEAEDRLEMVDVYGSARIRLAAHYVRRRRLADALRVAEPALRRCLADGSPGLILFERAAAVPVLRLAAVRGPHAAFAADLLTRLTGAEPARPLSGTNEVLTTREMEVLRLLSAGATNPEIAHELGVGVETVKTHAARLFRKLGATSRTEAALRARRFGVLTSET
ncbi:LuxR C-terminal-related transcriptional regulator [Micromonospora sp. NPDC049275]|uniref:LuxR C-terminal-related transcriptional regulator n=1 Tax=Micromonospora sp. NPDC049275 TaxID=3364268 RepID=UPI003721C380